MMRQVRSWSGWATAYKVYSDRTDGGRASRRGSPVTWEPHQQHSHQLIFHARCCVLEDSRHMTIINILNSYSKQGFCRDQVCVGFGLKFPSADRLSINHANSRHVPHLRSPRVTFRPKRFSHSYSNDCGIYHFLQVFLYFFQSSF